jgi:hypothetical protein
MELITPLRRSRTAFATMLGGSGEAVREAKDIQPALCPGRESGQGALIDVWVAPAVCAPGTMHQAMYN